MSSVTFIHSQLAHTCDAAEASVTAHSLQSKLVINSCAYPIVLTGIHAVDNYVAKPDMTLRQSDSHVAHINIHM